MRFLLAIFALLVACESPSETSNPPATTAATTAEPVGVPDRDPESFSAVTQGIDRVVLTERTVLVLDDAGMPKGDGAHPASYETTDRAWIDQFVRAVGPESKPQTIVLDSCEPWADLTLHRGSEAVASFPVDCSKKRAFATFRVRGTPTAFLGSNDTDLAKLLEQLTRD